MIINYCKWSRGYKRVVQKMPKVKAKKNHINRTIYYVVIGELNNPSHFIEFNDDFIYVGFLDENLDEYLKYQFTEIEKDKIFLKEAQF